MPRRVSCNIPVFPASLPGSIWAITAYFNPCTSKTRRDNYRIFRKAIKKQGLNLLSIELAFGKNQYDLTNDDADILIHRRSNSLLWQKERLINIGIKNLPLDCDKFIWIDANILFVDDDWINQTARLLEKYNIVQPFSHMVLLPSGKHNIQTESDFLKKVHKEPASAYKLFLSGTKCLKQKYPLFGWPGFAWAARRKIFEKLDLYDRLIMGGADTAMVHAFYGTKKISFCDDSLSFFEYSTGLRHDFEKWFDDAFSAIKGSVSFRKGIACHIYHGEISNRRYRERETMIKAYKYNPFSDIKLLFEPCYN